MACQIGGGNVGLGAELCKDSGAVIVTPSPTSWHMCNVVSLSHSTAARLFSVYGPIDYALTKT